MQPSLYRKQALDQATQSVDVHRHLRAVTPQSWLALTVLAVLAVAGITWSTLGRAPVTVNGMGLMVPGEGLASVVAPGDGVLSEFLVTDGATVTAGEVVATLVDADGARRPITSAVDGTVLQLVVSALGSWVRTGQSLVTLLPPSRGLQAVAFLQQAQATNVHPGMPAEISPVTVPAAQYGSIVATVASIDGLPTDDEQLLAFAGGNASLAQAVDTPGGSFRVVLDIAPDPATVTGYRWTFGQGPDYTVHPETLVDVRVNVQSRQVVTLAGAADISPREPR